MDNTARQTIHGRKVPSTISRSTTGTCRKTLSRSQSFLACPSTSRRTVLDENEGCSAFEKEFEKYEKEYSLYLLRVLQSKIVRGEGERGEEAKKCLVSLKKEYEDLLMENAETYNQIRKMEAYGKSIESLERDLSTARKLLKVLKENKFDEVLHKVAQNLECSINRMSLTGLKKEDFDEAITQNVLGLDSDIHKLLKRMEEYTWTQKTLVPEISEEIKEIASLHASNEKLRKRCTRLANELRSKSIALNYKKFCEMAVEECKDIVNWPAAEIPNGAVNESSTHRSVELWEPTSSSTPRVDLEADNKEEKV